MRATGLRGCKPADPSVPSPPLRRSPCSSIRKGVPLYGWKNRGEAPRRWLLSEQRLAGFRPSPGAAHAQAVPPTQASLGATGPTLEISGGVHKVPGLGPGTRKPSLHRTGRRVFPRTILCSRSPTHIESECPGKTWAPGAGAGPGQGSMPDGDGPGGRVAGPWKSSPWGLRPAPSSVAKSLPWAPTAPPCPEAANQVPAASTL